MTTISIHHYSRHRHLLSPAAPLCVWLAGWRVVVVLTRGCDQVCSWPRVAPHSLHTHHPGHGNAVTTGHYTLISSAAHIINNNSQSGKLCPHSAPRQHLTPQHLAPARSFTFQGIFTRPGPQWIQWDLHPQTRWWGCVIIHKTRFYITAKNIDRCQYLVVKIKNQCII